MTATPTTELGPAPMRESTVTPVAGVTTPDPITGPAYEPQAVTLAPVTQLPMTGANPQHDDVGWPEALVLIGAMICLVLVSRGKRR